MAQQADAFARDPFAAGTALYTDEGRPAPIDDTAARVRQARIVADRTGLPVPPYGADEITDMRRILADGPPKRRAAVLAHYDALPDNMKAAVDEGLTLREPEPSIMSDAADEGLQDGQQYAQAGAGRGNGRGGNPRPLTPRQETELMIYRSKVE